VFPVNGYLVKLERDLKKKNNRLSPEQLNQLLFLNSYFKLSPSFETLMEKLLEEKFFD
jgi:hypothetical protein